jgi:hypothetical protein
MNTADKLEILRKAYHDALLRYDGIAASLSRHMIAGTRPSAEELQHEETARLALDTARSQLTQFLEEWKQS